MQTKRSMAVGEDVSLAAHWCFMTSHHYQYSVVLPGA